MAEQVAIIKRVKFGLNPYSGHVVLSFTTYISESTAANQTMSVSDAMEMIQAYGVEDVHELNEKPCFVEVDGIVVKYSRPLIIK